jgi:hypothetical protein
MTEKMIVGVVNEAKNISSYFLTGKDVLEIYLKVYGDSLDTKAFAFLNDVLRAEDCEREYFETQNKGYENEN